MEKWKTLISLALVLIVGIALAKCAIEYASLNLERKKRPELTGREKMLLWVVPLVFAGVHILFGNVALSVILAVILVSGCFIAANAKKKGMAANAMLLLGLPASVAIIVNIIFALVANGKVSKDFLWLIAPLVFWLFLSVYGRIGAAKKPGKKLKLDFIGPLAATVVLAAVAVGLFIYSKGVI